MTQHLETCRRCGKQFDADTDPGALYDRSRKEYVCSNCARAMESRNFRANRGRNPSVGGTIAKAFFALMFLIVAFDMEETGETLMAVVIGLALLAWAVLPWLRRKRAEQQAAREWEADRRAVTAALRRERNAPWTCESCGATTKGDRCEYCGSPRK